MIKSIKYVAVLTNNIAIFNNYKKYHRTFSEEYIHIQEFTDLSGRVFTRRVLLDGWDKIKEIDELLSILATRIKM